MGMESVGSDVMSLERYGAVQFWKAKWRTAEEDLGTAAMRIEELEAELARLREALVTVDPVPAGGHRVEIRELHDPLDGVGATVVDCLRM